MKKSYIYAGISILLWSTTAAIIKLLVSDLTSMQITAGCTFFASLSLILLTIFQKKISIIKTYKFKDYLNFIILGFIGIFIYYLMLNKSINLLPAQEAFVINYLWPIMIMLFATFILKEKFSIYKLAALIISFMGVIIIATNGNLLGMHFNSPTGVLMAVVAAISYGLFSVLVKKKNYDVSTLMMFCYITAFIISIIYLGFKFPSVTIYQLIGVIWLGVFTQGIPYATWALALNSGDTSKISNLAFMTPILSTVFTFFILGERLEWYLLLGLIFIICGIFIQSKRKCNK